MAVTRCYLCEEEHSNRLRQDPADLEEGIVCPICHQPTCRRHLSTVRWRWRNATRDIASARICRTCKREFRHREWDPLNREWIT